MKIKQRPKKPLPAQRPAVIHWRGKTLSLAEAQSQAIEEQSLSHFQAAADIYQLMLERLPDRAEIHNNRGTVLQLMERYEEALTSYDKAIAFKPDYANAYYNRGSTLKRLNRREEALVSYDRAVALRPDHANAHNNRGILLQEMRRYEDALTSYSQAIAANPGFAEAYNNRGTALLNTGNMAEAERMFRKAIELRPNFPDPWFNLANLQRYQNADSAEAKAIRTLLSQPGLLPEDNESLQFTLGKIYDDCGRYDEAFECYREANKIRDTRVSYDAGKVARRTDEIIEVFSNEFLAGPIAFASVSPSPLFIVGMPRSGTTLLAQILSNHRAIAMAGELSIIGDFTSTWVESARDGKNYPQAARQLQADVATRLIQDYERRLRRDLRSDVPLVIDKNPLNFWHLGLIRMLFPQARIIHCVRNPLDTCLSNYFQRFPLYMDYAFDLRNIGHFYSEYARLMAHWRQIPSLRLFEVSYEEMVLHTEQTARKTLEFLGLDWDEHCLVPHTNPGPVETASLWQVRQPIYDYALGRWRHYERHLGPLKESLALPDKFALDDLSQEGGLTGGERHRA